MSWLDASEYLVLETGVRDRIDDLHRTTVTLTGAEDPAHEAPASRAVPRDGGAAARCHLRLGERAPSSA